MDQHIEPRYQASLDHSASITSKYITGVNHNPLHHFGSDAEDAYTSLHNDMNDNEDDDDGDIGFTFDRSDIDDSSSCDTFYSSCDNYYSLQRQIDEEEDCLEEQLVWGTELIWNESSTRSIRHLDKGGEAYVCRRNVCNKIVRFSEVLVTEVHLLPRKTHAESNLLFFSAHELQRNIDQNPNANDDMMS